MRNFLIYCERNLRFAKKIIIKYKYPLGITLSILLLLTVSVYSALQATAAQLSVGDQYNSTYMVSDWHPGDTINLLSQRTNLLKLPLLWVQGQLPYGEISQYILNTVLVCVTVFGWSLLTYLLLRNRTAFIISNLLLSGLLLSSVDFTISMTMPTIRNIEYLLAFGYILLLKSLFEKYSRLKYWSSILILGMLVASDYLFLYTLPIAVILGVLLAVKGLQKKQVVSIISTVIYGCIVGILLLKLLNWLGILHLIDIPRSFLAYDLLLIHAENMVHHIILLFGADFFGKPTSASLGYILNFLFFSAAMVCIYKIRKINFTGSVMSFFAILVMGAYLLSGQATTGGENIRYLTIIPFIGILSILIIIRNKIILFIIAGAVLVAGIFMFNLNRIEYGQRKIASRNFIEIDRKVVDYLRDNNINTALGTIAYSAPTWFYTKKEIDVYSIAPCNDSNLALSNSAWYKPNIDNKPIGLIIDHLYDTHKNMESWGSCDDKIIENIYGTPSSKKTVGFNKGSPVEVWIYNYDIRSKLKPYIY